MGSKYYDSPTAIQVIGCILNNPRLLEQEDKYTFREEDFCNELHKVIFGATYTLQTTGAQQINRKVIENYLADKPHSFGIYKANNGAEWMRNAWKNADVSNFDYYYQKLKKMTLLRTYNEIGFDVSWIYDPDNIEDTKKKKRQEEYLEEKTIAEIADEIDNKILRVREMVIDNDVDESCQIGEGMDKLVDDIQEKPIEGIPLFDPYFSEITLGARQGCFYIRSSSTGTGKSRSSMADACFFACDEYYDESQQQWVSLGECCPTVFISVELDIEELQTMALSFIGYIPENHIIRNEMSFEERERLKKAVQILKRSKLYVEYYPDYSLKDIENCIKRNLRTHNANIVVLDYIATSMKIIEEVSRASAGMRIREDQILYLLSSKLKDIATTYNVFILSSTQLNSSYKQEKILDQNMLSGAKSIANRVDVGAIMVDASPEDLKDIEELIKQNPGLGQPNIKLSVYKNRRGEYNRIVLWMKADKGTCRYKTLFATDYNFNLVTGILNRKGGK